MNVYRVTYHRSGDSHRVLVVAETIEATIAAVQEYQGRKVTGVVKINDTPAIVVAREMAADEPAVVAADRGGRGG
jgi:hypothetical protein